MKRNENQAYLAKQEVEPVWTINISDGDVQRKLAKKFEEVNHALVNLPDVDYQPEKDFPILIAELDTRPHNLQTLIRDIELYFPFIGVLEVKLQLDYNCQVYAELVIKQEKDLVQFRAKIENKIMGAGLTGRVEAPLRINLGMLKTYSSIGETVQLDSLLQEISEERFNTKKFSVIDILFPDEVTISEI